MLGHPGALLTPELGLLLPGLANIPFRDSNVLFICKPTDPELVTPATFAVGLPHSGPLSTHPNHRKASFSSVTQSCPTLCSPWTAVCQASLSITNNQSLLKLMSTEWVMPSNHLILYHPLLLLPSIFPSIRVFSNESSSHQVAKVLEFQLQQQSFQ